MVTFVHRITLIHLFARQYNDREKCCTPLLIDRCIKLPLCVSSDFKKQSKWGEEQADPSVFLIFDALLVAKQDHLNFKLTNRISYCCFIDFFQISFQDILARKYKYCKSNKYKHSNLDFLPPVYHIEHSR